MCKKERPGGKIPPGRKMFNYTLYCNVTERVWEVTRRTAPSTHWPPALAAETTVYPQKGVYPMNQKKLLAL